MLDNIYKLSEHPIPSMTREEFDSLSSEDTEYVTVWIVHEFEVISVTNVVNIGGVYYCADIENCDFYEIETPTAWRKEPTLSQVRKFLGA